MISCIGGGEMDIKQYIDEYANWLKNEITFSKVGEYYEINTPFLDIDNDYFQFYVKQDGNEIFFTDDGYTINNLEATGFKMTKARQQQLTYILNQYGVKLDNYELILKAPAKEFAQRKHAYTQCLMRVSDLYMTSRTKVTSYFLDDIQDFFLQNDIYCMENVQFKGKSGFSHNYDFAIQRSKYKPERLCLAINNPTKAAMGNALFAWEDTKPERKEDSQLIILLNDSNPIGKGIEDGFANYSVNTIRWSERQSKNNMAILSA